MLWLFVIIWDVVEDVMKVVFGEIVEGGDSKLWFIVDGLLLEILCV